MRVSYLFSALLSGSVAAAKAPCAAHVSVSRSAWSAARSWSRTAYLVTGEALPVGWNVQRFKIKFIAMIGRLHDGGFVP